MHPLSNLLGPAIEAGLDFMIVLGGNRELRLKMGLPSSVLDRDPLLLTFPAMYHPQIHPTVDENGLTCVLSFDSLYACRLPWTAVRQVIVQTSGDDSWPAAWKTEEEEAAEKAAASAPPPPDNVRAFRPRPRSETV